MLLVQYANGYHSVQVIDVYIMILEGNEQFESILSKNFQFHFDSILAMFVEVTY